MEQQQESVTQVSDATKVSVRAFRLEQRIGVLVEHRGWAQHFCIRLKDGELPSMYRNDPEIVAAFNRCRAHFEKWKAKEDVGQAQADDAKKDAVLLDRAETLIAISKNVGYPLSADSSNPALDEAIYQVEKELAGPPAILC